MKRREFIALLAGIAGASSAQAQVKQRPVRIGWLAPLSPTAAAASISGLRSGLRELGWVEDRDYSFEFRFADGVSDRLPKLASELVALNVDLIVTGSTPGALAAKGATSKIPIVFVTTGDPVAGGIITSLGRPGGNLTGVTTLGVELAPKRLQLLKELQPGLKRVATLIRSGSPYAEEFRSSAGKISSALGVELLLIDVQQSQQLTDAFDKAVAARADAVLVLSDVLFITQRSLIIELAAKAKLPMMLPDREFVTDGGLMFYGAGLKSMYHHVATHADKVLKGAKPADLPVEQPTRFELIINLKTAKSLGIELPASILVRADEVIE